MKKLKKFINSKGGLKVIIVSLALVLVALFCVIVGIVYGDFGGDWSKIGEILTNDFAIAIYIIVGLIVLLLISLIITMNRKKEI